MRRAALALVVAACGTGAPALPSPRDAREIESGGRLRARKWIIGGHEVFRDFFDRVTGEPCTFANNVGPGPSYRCLPVSAALHAEGQGPFIDSACTIPAGIVVNAPSSYVIVERVNACTNERAVYRAGALQRSKTYALDGYECTPLSALPIDVQRLEGELPVNAFVRAFPVIEETRGRIVRTSLAADDGARQPFHAFDRERNEHVTVDTGNFIEEDGKPAQRWRPLRVAFVNAGPPLFADDACMMQAATKVGRDAACPLTAALVFQGLCGEYAVHALGEPVVPKTKEGSFCQEAKSRSLAFTLGAPIARDAFPLVARVDVEREGIRRYNFTGPDGNLVFWGDVLAPISGEPCLVAPANDGVDRCLPAQTAAPGTFADPACTVPAIRFASTGCAKEAVPRYVRIEDRAFRVEEEAKKAFMLEAGRCSAATLAENESTYGISEVDVRQFPAAKE